jgi:hypothetical protein
MTHCLIETCGGNVVDASPRKARDVFLAAIKLPSQEREAYCGKRAAMTKICSSVSPRC